MIIYTCCCQTTANISKTTTTKPKLTDSLHGYTIARDRILGVGRGSISYPSRSTAHQLEEYGEKIFDYNHSIGIHAKADNQLKTFTSRTEHWNKSSNTCLR